ncbi:MAG: hypothetical protein IKK24_05920, partial [Clostridia bacterium]|nr:hypothetical protein [Clostridia bacterium]
VDGFADNSDWLRIAFIKDLENEERYASDVKIRYADGILCCDEFKNGIVYFSTSFYASDRVHFMQARPVTNNDAVTGYSIYIDGKPFNSNGFTISLEDFNYYNNYNSQTGEFDGCHLEMLALGTPKVGIWTPTEERFTGSFDGAFSYIENAKGFDDITLGNKGRANSTWQFDFLDGVKFAVDGLEENNGNDFVTVGFSANLWELRKGNFAGNIDKSFKLKNVDGKLAISVFNGTQYGSYSTLKIDVSKPYTLKAVEVSVGDETLYNFYIGGCEIKEFSMTEDEFYNFNYATGGVYVGFSANTGAELKDVCKAVLGDSPFIETANFSSVNKNGSYDMKFGGQGIAISNWQTDLTKGIIFSMDDFTNDDGTDWLQLVFLADNKKTHEVYPVGVIIKQRNGQLYAAATDGFGEWSTTFFGPAVGTHLLKAVPLEGSGENFYRLTIDGKDFSGVFAIPEQDFKNINNHNQTDDTFTGTHIKFMASQGVKFSVFVPGDAAFVGEDGFTYTTTDNGKYNLSLAEDGYAITSWQAELTEGIAFNVEKLNGVVSLRLANNLWLMSREDGIPTKNRQPLIKLKEENGALYACVSDDDATENYSLLKDVSVSGEHILSAKKSVLAGSEETVYRLYIDNVEIDGSYYLSLEDFNLINNYDAPSDIFTGATVRFAATKAVVINNIYKAVDFEGGDFTYREVSEGHYNLNVGYYSYAYSKWKADMTAGIAFNVEYANGWIMIRFCNDFETMGIDEVANTYQPVLLLRNDEDGLYAAIMNGLMHKSATKLKGVTLTGTHILNAKLAPDRTGVMCYRFYLDGMPIVKDYTMSTSVVKKINGYNKEKGIFEGAQVYFSSQNGAIINDIYKLTTGETVTNGIWDTASDAKVTKVGDNTYDMDMKALSSLRSSLAVNIEKGITITAQNGTNFGIALSMLPGGTLLDVPPVIADT